MMATSVREKREHVLATALPVFSALGYSRTTMADLAKAAGMSRPALYLVFPGKEELFSVLVDASADELKCSAILTSGPGLSPLSDWMVWACRLWAGSGFGTQHEVFRERSYNTAKLNDYELFERVLSKGIERRLSLGESGDFRDLVRMIAASMLGLSEVPIPDGERRRLLDKHVQLVARAAGWVCDESVSFS